MIAEPRELTTADRLVVHRAELEQAKAWMKYYTREEHNSQLAKEWQEVEKRLKKKIKRLMAQLDAEGPS